jgi:hypothetical protein
MIECMVRKNVFIFFFKVPTIVSVFKLGNGIYHLLKRSVWSLKKVFGDRFGVLAFQFTQMNANLEISQCMGFQVLAKGMIQGRHCNSLHEDNVW